MCTLYNQPIRHNGYGMNSGSNLSHGCITEYDRFEVHFVAFSLINR